VFTGSFVPLITPFKNGSIDQDALVKLVHWHKSEGSYGLIVCGTTGEALLLTPQERQQITQIVLREAQNDIPIIVGTGALTTRETIHHTQNASTAGACAALVLTPYFVTPSQEALYQHYTHLSQATEIPIFLYNNPGQAGSFLEVETILRLAKHPNIIGIKDADLRRIKAILTQSQDFLVFVGDDNILKEALAEGCHGFVSATANLIPKTCARLYKAYKNKDAKAFEALLLEFNNFYRNLYGESIPSVLKYGLSTMGKCFNEVRNPLLPIQKKTQKAVEKALKISPSKKQL